MKNDLDDVEMTEKDKQSLQSTTKIRQKKENIFREFEMMEIRLRSRKEAEGRDERERAETYHKMDCEQVKVQTMARTSMCK
jgi:hypothetical protein